MAISSLCKIYNQIQSLWWFKKLRINEQILLLKFINNHWIIEWVLKDNTHTHTCVCGYGCTFFHVFFNYREIYCMAPGIYFQVYGYRTCLLSVGLLNIS